MRMYPRRYSPLNRAIARSVSHAVNQKYRSNGGKTKTSANTNLDIGSSLIILFFIILLLYFFPILIIPFFFIALYSI